MSENKNNTLKALKVFLLPDAGVDKRPGGDFARIAAKLSERGFNVINDDRLDIPAETAFAQSIRLIDSCDLIVVYADSIVKDKDTGLVWVDVQKRYARHQNKPWLHVGDNLKETPVPAEVTKALNTAIRDCYPSRRFANCLAAVNIQTVGDLARCTRRQIAQIRNFGAHCLREADDILDRYGLRYGADTASYGYQPKNLDIYTW